jgi:hypothetical protein
MIVNQGEVVAELELPGKTLAQGFAWLQAELTQLEQAGNTVQPLTYPANDFPDHPLAQGAVFAAEDPEIRQALVRYYDLTLPLLTNLVQETPGASPIHMWPHHFDMATLVALPTPENQEQRSVGLGFSPGDGGYGEPYWYVTPWPYPPADQLPTLPGPGTWHHQGWIGAVLQSSEIVTATAQDSSQVSQAISTFFQNYSAAARSLLQ